MARHVGLRAATGRLAIALALLGPALAARPVHADPPPQGALPQASPRPAKVFRCTWEQCVDRALKRSPLVAAAALSLDSYESKLAEAKTAAYPKFDASAFLSVLPREKPGTDGTNPFTDYDFSHLGPLVLGTFSVAQPLYTFGKIEELRRLAEHGVDIGAATRRIAEDEMRYQMARAFWGLVMVREMRDMITDGRKLLEEQRAKVEKERDENDERFNQSDLLKLQIMTADLEDRVRQTERGRQQALDGLRLAMNDPADLDIDPQAEFKPILFDVLPGEAYEALALMNSPKLLAMRNGTQARLVQVQLAKDQMYPDIVLVARIAGTYAPTRNTTPDSLVTNPNNTASSGAGVAVRWSIDLFRNLAKIDQADIDYRQQVLQEAGEREKARMDVRQMYREMVDARAMVGLHEQAMKSARGWLNSENQKYEDGFADDMTQVQFALEAYYRRRISYFESILSYNLSVAALSRATGMDVSKVRSVPGTPQVVNLPNEVTTDRGR